MQLVWHTVFSRECALGGVEDTASRPSVECGPHPRRSLPVLHQASYHFFVCLFPLCQVGVIIENLRGRVGIDSNRLGVGAQKWKLPLFLMGRERLCF